MSRQQSKVVSQKQEKVENDEQIKHQKQGIFQIDQKHMNQLIQQHDVVTTNAMDLMTSRSDGHRTLSRLSEGMSQQILPLSHQRREKSLSPIKRENSIFIEQNHSVTFMRRNTPTNIQFETIKIQQLQKQSKFQDKQPFFHYEPQKSETQSIIHASLRQEKNISVKSSRKVQVRRPQIFSSDKKHTQKNLKLNTNTVAEQIFHQNKQERINRHQIYKQLQIENHTPSNKYKRQQKSLSLSQSKKKQIQKLSVISASPLKATQQYWKGIYPQSKKYINSLKDTLYEQKQILRKWQSDLKATLRQNLYEVQEILLQKFYQISRQCVKIWVHQELSNLQKLWISDFTIVQKVQQDIQKNEIQLQEYEKLLEDLNRSFKESKQINKKFLLFEKGIYSVEINKAIAQTSQKVKQVVSNTELLAIKMCGDKLLKANSLNDFQQEKNQNRLDFTINNLLKNLFKPRQMIMTPRKQSQKNFNKKDFHIGQKIKLILDKSQEKEPQTTRQQIVKQFQFSDTFLPYSHRKTAQTPVIKNNQKEFKQFKYEFEKRQKKFINNGSMIESNKKKNLNFQQPISQKSNKKTNFDQKLSNLFKKITQQKDEEPQETNRSSIQANNFNDYNDLIRKKKQQNRENFFRYSIQ